MSYQSPFTSTLLDTSLFANRYESPPCNDNKDAEHKQGFDVIRDFFAAPADVVVIESSRMQAEPDRLKSF